MCVREAEGDGWGPDGGQAGEEGWGGHGGLLGGARSVQMAAVPVAGLVW